MTKPPWVTEIGVKHRTGRDELVCTHSVTKIMDVIKARMLTYIREGATPYVVFLQDYGLFEDVERLEARLYVVNDIEALRRDYHELEMYRREAQKDRLQDLKEKENRDG